MPIVNTDLVFKLTTKSGVAGYTNAQPDPNESLGGFTSTTDLVTGKNTLFDDITGPENKALATEYRAIDILNNHPTLTLLGAVVYLADPSGGAFVHIAVDNVGPVDKGAAVQGESIPNFATAPVNVSAFANPAYATNGLALGDIGPGQIRRIWIRRAALNNGVRIGDYTTLYVAGDTNA